MTAQDYIQEVFRALCRQNRVAYPDPSAPPEDWKGPEREKVQYRFIMLRDGHKADLTLYHEKKYTDWAVLKVFGEGSDYVMDLSARGNDGLKVYLDYKYLDGDLAKLVGKLAAGMLKNYYRLC